MGEGSFCVCVLWRTKGGNARGIESGSASLGNKQGRGGGGGRCCGSSRHIHELSGEQVGSWCGRWAGPSCTQWWMLGGARSKIGGPARKCKNGASKGVEGEEAG